MGELGEGAEEGCWRAAVDRWTIRFKKLKVHNLERVMLMAERIAQTRQSVIGSKLCGEDVAPHKEVAPSGEEIIKNPIHETKRDFTVTTTRFRATFSADGTQRLEGPISYKEPFKSQAVFMFDAQNKVGLGKRETDPQRERFFVERRGNTVKYGSLMHPDVVFGNNGELGRLNNPFIEISPTMVPKLQGELGDRIRNAAKDAGTLASAAAELKAGMKEGETYKEGTVYNKGFQKKKEPGVFVRTENGAIVEFGPLEHRNEFSFGMTKDEGISVIIKPQSSESLKKRLGETESGVVVGMVHDNISHFVPQVSYFTNELDKLMRSKEVAEFIEKHERS
jgi:hypothetical protein